MAPAGRMDDVGPGFCKGEAKGGLRHFCALVIIDVIVTIVRNMRSWGSGAERLGG